MSRREEAVATRRGSRVQTQYSWQQGPRRRDHLADCKVPTATSPVLWRGHVSPRTPLSEHAGQAGMLQGAASTTQSEQQAGQVTSMDPGSDGCEPQLKTTHGEGSQAALTDVGSVIVDQEFVPGLPLRTAPCSPSSSRGSPPAASCWP